MKFYHVVNSPLLLLYLYSYYIHFKGFVVYFLSKYTSIEYILFNYVRQRPKLQTGIYLVPDLEQ